MCGIAGLAALGDGPPATGAELTHMARTLLHRGPDDVGFLLGGNSTPSTRLARVEPDAAAPVGFAHQRLRVIDLAGSRQPMGAGDGRYWLVYNGEVYNYVELRDELEARGHCFDTTGDTEVVLRAFLEWGEACVDRLNGMFAFVVWDREAGRLFLARDRFGIKPLYYAVHGGRFGFASEIKALLGTVVPEARLNPAGLADYLAFQFYIGEKSLFAGVQPLLPAHTMRVDLATGSIETQRYWTLDFSVDTHHTEAYFVDTLRTLLADAVRWQRRSDVPLGAYLSGGLDSSAVVCLMSDAADRALHCFTGAFREGPQFDETPFAQVVLDHAGATGHTIYPTADAAAAILPSLVYAMDEPAAGPGLIPQAFVSQLAREHVTVVLGGQGGDEIFGGYARYLVAYLEQALKGAIFETQEEGAFVVTLESIIPNLPVLQEYHPLMAHFWGEGLFGDMAERYYRLIARNADCDEIYAPEFLAQCDGAGAYEEFRALFNRPDTRSYINKMTAFDMATLLPALLQVEDRMSMRVSLESRVPLLDHRVVELIAAMPPDLKFHGGRTKHVLRRAVTGTVPPAILNRKDKKGFPVPLAQWAQGPSGEGFRAVLEGGVQRGWLRPDAPARLADPDRPFDRRLWGALCLELWAQAFLDGRGAG